jgi:ABC-2 type transport system permease protein
MLVISLLYYLILLPYGVPSLKLVLITMIGFLLLSMAYTALGIFISSITESQVIAAVVTLVCLMLPLFVSLDSGVASYFSLIDFFTKMPSGVISINEIFGLLSFTIMCISLVVVGIKRRRMYK